MVVDVDRATADVDPDDPFLCGHGVDRNERRRAGSGERLEKLTSVGHGAPPFEASDAIRVGVSYAGSLRKERIREPAAAAVVGPRDLPAAPADDGIRRSCRRERYILCGTRSDTSE